MTGSVKLAGHSVHPMLIVFPLGLLATSVIFDIITLASGSPRWSLMAFYMIGAGVIGGLAAAVFGFLDWLSIPRYTRAWAVGLWHGIGNVAVVSLFFASWFLRYSNPMIVSASALVLSFCGVILALVTGWMGGELVERLGIGVDRGAHANSPSSLSGRSAAENADDYQQPPRAAGGDV